MKVNWPRLAVDVSVYSASGEDELTLNSIPLHTVLVGDLSETVLDNGGQGIVVEMVVVDLSSEVELPLGLELVVQAGSTARRRWGVAATRAGSRRGVRP